MGCKLKSLFGLIIHCLFVALRFSPEFDEIVFYPVSIRKNLLIIINKFFSIYNYLFRFFFLIRFSMNILRFRAGGDDGIRTHDPLLAGQVLSQLSYTPKNIGNLPFLLFALSRW